MIIVNHRKTYSLECKITERDSLYNMFAEAHDKRESDPWLHTDEIFEFINKEVRPLVPFKKTYTYGYRLHKKHNGDIEMVVTFDLSNKEFDIIH